MISIIERCRGANASRAMLTTAGAFALAAMPAARAWAGVEYVTRTTNCTVHIAGPGDALTVQAGPGMTFEVWGNSVDLAPSIKTGGALTGASIVARHSGSDNSSRGCGFVGSMVVSVTSNATITTSAAASLAFQMPLGDFSTLSMTIVPFPALAQPTWTTSGTLQPSNLPCIVKTGSITTINQDTKLVIQLPPGAAQDQTTCTSNVLTVRVLPASTAGADVAPTIKYGVSGLPSYMTESQATAELPTVGATLAFTFNVAGIRALTTTSSSTITIKDPINTNRTTTLAVQVSPSAGLGFATVATANPTGVTVGNPIDFTVTLSAPAGSAGQVISWRMTQANCFANESGGGFATYSQTALYQLFTIPAGQTSAIIRVLSANGSGCTSKLGPVTQLFEAWVGNAIRDPQVAAVTSGPTYTRTTVKLSL